MEGQVDEQASIIMKISSYRAGDARTRACPPHSGMGFGGVGQGRRVSLTPAPLEGGA